MDITNLRNQCRNNGLRVSGTCDELIERLKENNLYNQLTNTLESEFEIYGKSIGADVIIVYGSPDIVGYYKKDGMSYDRPSYSKINNNGNFLKNGKINIYYKASLDSCGNFNNSLYKGSWIIGTNKFNNPINYYNICEENHSYTIPLNDWEDEIDIKILN